MNTIIEHYRVDRREIAFIKFIFEGYDGIAGLTTMDPTEGIIRFYIAVGSEEQVHRVLRDLNKTMLIRRMVTVPDKRGKKAVFEGDGCF